MKNKVRQNRLAQILIAILAIFAIQANCNGVDPKDERLQSASQVQIFDQGLYLYQLSITNITLPPPRITTPESPYKEVGEVIVSGYSITRTQLESRNYPSISPLSTTLKVRLYKLEIAGEDCNDSNRLIKSEFLGEVDLNDSGKWEIKVVLAANSLIAATISTGVQESPLSNIVMSLDTAALNEAFFSEKNGWGSYKEAVKIPLEGVKDIEEEYIPFTISGKGMQGWCVRAWIENDQGAYLEWSRTNVNKNGNWSLSVPVLKGYNKYSIEVLYPNELNKPIPDLKRDVALVGVVYPDFNPVWPFGTTNQEGIYIPKFKGIQITAWFGPNDYHKNDSISRGYHDGIDIGAVQGTSVKAIAKGCVYQIRTTKDNGGWAVFIDHGSWVSYYYHMDKNSIPEKLMSVPTSPRSSTNCIEVNAGEEIGKVGEERHLHLAAFFWGKNNRTSTLKDTNFLTDIGGGRVVDVKGRLINVNPSKDVLLENQKPASNILYTCAGIGFWGNLDWSAISLSWKEGTSFNYLNQELKSFGPNRVYWQNCLKTPIKK